MMEMPRRHHECWVLDARPLAALAIGRRRWVAVVVDVRSRMTLGCCTRGSRTAAVWGALSAALTKWGAPERIVVDRARDLPEAVLADLGVTIESPPAHRPSVMALAERALREVAS